MVGFSELRDLFARHGQGHIFRHWRELSEQERETLLADCRQVDFKWLAARQAQLRSSCRTRECRLEPAPIVRLPRTPAEKAAAQRARRMGEKALRSGRVAAFVVAGGQGTRLNFAGPKGCYPVGPVSGRTLFQWHAEQILAQSRRYGVKIPWYIMTSRDNDAAIRRYFASQGYFGFPAEDIMFFSQRMVPALTADGNLLLANKCHLAMNPDGHGGALPALAHSGALADMRRRGIEIVSYFQVDNPLVNICDPIFLGYHLLADAEMSLKVVEKRTPHEKVGHPCAQNGRLAIIEYTEMPRHLAEARDRRGRLRFWAGSIAIHLFQVSFLERLAAEVSLPWHRADKKIPVWRHGRVH
ncbi:MAG: UTP--glucose-1-phosphate uridylyltransferase, partial [Planctomycetota bacterium]|nr:UTP--glucose-1-phosphate uridylyltransferase [Planctomycetota bacterium]